MSPRPSGRRPLRGQVVVVTGASSGIGLETIRRAAGRGAKVVAVARDAPLLRTTVAEIEAGGGEAIYVAADVAEEADIRRVVEVATTAYGGIDVWVNNAGVGVYETLLDLPLDEHRRIFETNYWGTVHGSLAAVRHFRQRGRPGRLVNVGSVNGDVSIPLLSAYSASKHAVKGFTDALRRELLHAGDDITVTLVKPAGVATPFPQHARNHMDSEPRVAPPLYAPELVADAILHAARRPVRDIAIGSVGPILNLLQALLPGVTDRVLAAVVPRVSRSSHPLTRSDNLDAPAGGGKVHYAYFKGLPVSLSLSLQKHPLALSAGALLFLVACRRRAARHLRRGLQEGDADALRRHLR